MAATKIDTIRVRKVAEAEADNVVHLQETTTDAMPLNLSSALEVYTAPRLKEEDGADRGAQPERCRCRA